jgi:RND family efflux transporter MFP subunit
MRTIYLLLLTTFILVSCGEKKQATLDEVIATQDLTKIRAKKTELDQQNQEISEKIKLLIAEIDKLDTLKRVPLVTALEVKEEIFTHYLELQGDVKTKQNVLIYPEIPGILEKIYVTKGQNVVKGQVLATINDGGMSQQVAQLEATTSLAKTTFERQKRLWEQKIGSEIQFLQSKTNYEAQKNSLDQFKKQLNKATIRAPFSGVIDDIIKEQGTVVSPGPSSEIFRIVNLNNMYIETAVPETYITNITKGKEVQVLFPVLDKNVTSKVRETGNFINPANRTFMIEIEVPNSDKNIKPNLTAKLKINDYTNPKAILIPQSIISENAEGQQYVYIITDLNGNKGFAKQTVVKTGKTQGDIIEILEGITTGDILIQAGARSVKNGQEVKITE